MWNWFKGAKAAPAKGSFPFRLETVHGRDAFSRFEQLKSAGRGAPIIIGNDDALNRIVGCMRSRDRTETAQSLVRLAERNPFPDALRAQEAAYIRKLKESDPDWPEEEDEPPVGEWPDYELAGQNGPLIPFDVLSGKPLERVHIALIPTQDRTEIPAYLRWGDWNACPSPSHHVAAARSWRDRYGAELVAMSGDMAEYRVTRRPATREEAMVLAREQHDYCDDLVSQGVGDLSTLAASLMNTDWWSFWWD